MFKKIKILSLSLILLISSSSSIFAENEHSYIISKFDGYSIKEVFKDDEYKVYTYKDDELLYITFSKDDGNLYMLINDKEILAMEIVNETNDVDDFITSKALKRAPSNFLLTSSGVVQRIKINIDVINVGVAAVESLLLSYVHNGFDKSGLKMAIVNQAVLDSLALYIVHNYTTYDTNITRNNYVYNGCNWLYYSELIFPSGQVVEGYAWSDNPGSGIASSVCKLASQTYPYK